VERLDARQDELIAKLDELNSQIEAALGEFCRSRDVSPIEGEQRAAA
jgi:cell division protein FtsB